jgi:beta-glucosidase
VNEASRFSAGVPAEQFRWGTATSAYQIEGAHDHDGKGLSIWDVFARRRGTVCDGTTGEVACDHYHRYEEDVAIMNGLGTNAYRFSVSWPRVIPEGVGRANSAGLDFYDRLVDLLLANDIEPFVTLFHWDYPYALQQVGGWERRDAASWFAAYAETVAERLGDRVKYWMTLNEPLTFMSAGYLTGHHAPGIRNFWKAVKAGHHLLLGHGRAVRALRGSVRGARVGIANNLFPIVPHRLQDRRVAERLDAIANRFFMDPVLKGHYPKVIEKPLSLLNPRAAGPDMDEIGVPIDFLGVNHYARTVIRRSLLPLVGFATVRQAYEGVKITEMDWEVFPQSFYDVLTWIRDEYGNVPVFVTENGAAFDDQPQDGRVHDVDRVAFLEAYLAAMERAIRDGADVRGYFVWSFLDNFEWSEGYRKRFGLVYVHYPTQQRIVKDSGRWYASFIARQQRGTRGGVYASEYRDSGSE